MGLRNKDRDVGKSRQNKSDVFPVNAGVRQNDLPLLPVSLCASVIISWRRSPLKLRSN